MPPLNAPTPQYQGPTISPSVPWDTRIHLQQIYQKLGNHVQGISLLSTKVSALTGSDTSTVIETIGGGGGGGGSTATPVGQVNNLTGLVSYMTQAGDNGALIVLSDASPIAVTLAAGSVPYFVMVANLGSGTATLTPAAPPSGTSTISYAANPGAASMPLLGGYGAIIGFDGNNWFALTEPLVPITIGASAHLWLNSYDSTTGLFTATQPAFTDISGSLAGGQLPANVPVVSYGAGAPAGSSTESFFYFDTTGSPYHGYVYHSGAWQQFS